MSYSGLFCCIHEEHIELFHSFSFSPHFCDCILLLVVLINFNYFSDHIIFLVSTKTYPILCLKCRCNIQGRVWSVSRKNLMAADVARRGLTRFGEVHLINLHPTFCPYEYRTLFIPFHFLILPPKTITEICFIL